MGFIAWYLLRSNSTISINQNPADSGQNSQAQNDSLFKSLPNFPGSTPRPQEPPAIPEAQEINPGETEPRTQIGNSEPASEPEIVRSLDQVRPGSQPSIVITNPDQYECYTQYRGGRACFDNSYRPNRPSRSNPSSRRFFRRSGAQITDERIRRDRAEETICTLNYLDGRPVPCGLPGN